MSTQITTPANTRNDVVVERLIRATPERIFRALTVASELEKWFFTEARTDPRTGGDYRLEWRAAEGAPHVDHTRHGRYIEVVPNRKVVFEWLGSEGERPGESCSLGGLRTLVTITLSPEGESTRLRLVHTGFDDTQFGRDIAAGHNGGWTFYFGNLDRYLTGGADLRATDGAKQRVKTTF